MLCQEDHRIIIFALPSPPKLSSSHPLLTTQPSSFRCILVQGFGPVLLVRKQESFSLGPDSLILYVALTLGVRSCTKSPPDTALGGFASFGGKPQRLGIKPRSQNLMFYPSFIYRKTSML